MTEALHPWECTKIYTGITKNRPTWLGMITPHWQHVIIQEAIWVDFSYDAIELILADKITKEIDEEILKSLKIKIEEKSYTGEK